MELRHIRYFLAAAHSQNFTNAADILHITQPTLSHQIKQLEEEIGCNLFDRVGRSVRLTQAGELFREYAKRMVREVDSATDAIHDLGNLRHGKLTIGVFSSFSTSLLPPILAHFSAAYPGIKVTVLELPTGEMEKRLREGEINFGVAYGPPAADQVIAEELFKEQLALVVGVLHPLFGKPTVRMEELSQYGLIMLTREYISRGLVEAAFAACGCKPHIAMEMNSIEPILATVRCSSLGTLLSDRLVRTLPGLHPVLLLPPIVRTVSLFTRQNASVSAAARAMAALIKSSF
ncbi:MAG: transcriptional regulator CynR [Candidimonas sp.]|nr:MAG: transcriptional regulator CynR [Candidimonas sp.]